MILRDWRLLTGNLTNNYNLWYINWNTHQTNQDFQKENKKRRTRYLLNENGNSFQSPAGFSLMFLKQPWCYFCIRTNSYLSQIKLHFILVIWGEKKYVNIRRKEKTKPVLPGSPSSLLVEGRRCCSPTGEEFGGNQCFWCEAKASWAQLFKQLPQGPSWCFRDGNF